MHMDDVRRAERVPGITIRRKTPTPGQTKPWGIYVDVRLNGKRYNPSGFFATEAEAEAAYPAAAARLAKWRKEAAYEASVKRALTVPPVPALPAVKVAQGVETFETIALRWLEEHIRPTTKAATYLRYKSVLTNHLIPLMGDWPVNDETMIKPRIRPLFKVALPARGVSLTSRRFCLARLIEILKWAMDQLPPRQLTWNAAHGEGKYIRNVHEAPVEAPEPNPMTRGQVEAFLAWVKAHEPSLWEFFLWSVDHGSRVGEVCALKWTHLDLERGKAHIREAFSDKHRRMERLAGGAMRRQDEVPGLGETTTKMSRTKQFIDLSPRVVEALVALRKRQKEDWLSRGRYGKEPVHCFLNSRLQPRRPDRLVYKTFRAACEALGLVGQTGEPFTIHCLRDTFVTLAILEGHPIGWVREMVGHKNETTIRDHYYRWVRQVEANPFEAGRK